MEVCALKRGSGAFWRRRHSCHLHQLRGHTSTQPSSIEEEGSHRFGASHAKLEAAFGSPPL